MNVFSLTNCQIVYKLKLFFMGLDRIGWTIHFLVDYYKDLR